MRIGDYTVVDRLGAEDAGEFLCGEHVLLPRTVALKVLREGADRRAAMAMMREACLVEALGHPGIPRIYECGVLPDKRPWTAYELVDGASIATTIAAAPMPLADVILMLRDVADVLDHIHHRGIVHRALSAEAIVLTPRRRFSLLVRHWGEACTLDAAGIAADPRDDVYELGRIAFHALSGERHTTGATAEGTCPSVPSDITQLIDHMLDHDVTQRPPSAEVHARCKWLAMTSEQMPAPPRKTTRENVPLTDFEDLGIAIRIGGRTVTR